MVKKNEMAEKTVEIIRDLSVPEGPDLSWRSACKVSDQPYSSVMRWKLRIDDSRSPICKRGPRKLLPLDLNELKNAMSGLVHCPKRTRGSGELYRFYQDSISRRDFRSLVNLARKDANAALRNKQKRIRWLESGLVWALDETELFLDFCDQKIIMLNMRDLCSGLKFNPAIGLSMPGEKIAAYLDEQFSRFGAPLFLKRDNGSALNDDAVDKVLEKYSVIPLNSPEYYPPYNGAIEHDQFEIKAAASKELHEMPGFSLAHAEVYAARAVHGLNLTPRRNLDNKCSYQFFFEKKGGLYSRKKRGEIFNRIFGLARWIHSGMQKAAKRSFTSAWRIAAESWLVATGLIEVRVKGKVSPYFHPFLSHQ